MASLSENELRAVAYYAVGVGTEGSDTAYQLSFCGQPIHQAGVFRQFDQQQALSQAPFQAQQAQINQQQGPTFGGR